MGLGVNRESQNKPFSQWLAAKTPAALGGLFAHTIYQQIVALFAKQSQKYGPDIVGSIGLALIAYILDHNLWGWSKSFSDDATQSFTDGMMGRGAPAVFNAVSSVWNGLTKVVGEKAPSAGKAANASMGASLDNAPEVVADMMSLLASSPETRQRLAKDLIETMEKHQMRLDDKARSNIANCIGDLANTYKQ